MKLLLIHGPNLNLLGRRDSKQYGTHSLKDIETLVKNEAGLYGYDVVAIQSNHEGVLIDWIQTNAENARGIIINPGALTHYSYALHDAILDARIPCIEVHLSDTAAREEWRKKSVISPACIGTISGKKEQGYKEALFLLLKKINSSHASHE